MGDIPKTNGRKVGEFVGSADFSLAQAKRTLYDVLGETDPVAYLLALRVALASIEEAHLSIREIDTICKLDAVRGNYQRGQKK